MTSSHIPSVHHTHRSGFHCLGVAMGSVHQQYSYASGAAIMQQVIMHKRVPSIQQLKRLCMTKIRWDAQGRWRQKPYILSKPWFMTYLMHGTDHAYLMVSGSAKAYILK